MPFDSTAKNIIEKNISNVVCIDDEFEEPYSEEKSKKKLDERLYTGFKEKGCNVNIIKYRKEVLEDIKKRIYNNDLVILDWELQEDAPKYEPTLGLLSEILNANASFICIYTHSKDTTKIDRTLRHYFSGYSLEKVNEFYKNVEEVIAENYSDIFDTTNLKNDLIKYLEKPQLHGAIINSINLYLEDIAGVAKKERKTEIKKMHALLNNINCSDMFKMLGLYFEKAILPEKKPNTIVTLNQKNYIYLLDGKVILIKNKDEITTDFTVAAGDLYDSISKNVSTSPNTILTLLWIELKNYLSSVQNINGTFLKEIDELAFLNHRLEADLSEEGLKEFIVNILSDELKFILQSFESELLGKTLDSYLEKNDIKAKIKSEKEKNELIDKVSKLNHLITFNPSINSYDKIRFGDLFKEKLEAGAETSPNYYLCVTPHCDCIDPPQKIDSNFIFVESNEWTCISGIKTLDSEYLSFVKNQKGKYKPINWVNKDMKIKTRNLYIKDIDKRNLKAFYKNKTIQLEYIGNQKENFTQRIANYAYSWMNRVGVSYSMYEKKEE